MNGTPPPPAVPGPEGQVGQGWVSYEGEQALIIDVPSDAALPPIEVVEAIRRLEEQILVGLVPGPQVEAARVREFESSLLGLACPECQAETGWEYLQWCLFLTREGE